MRVQPSALGCKAIQYIVLYCLTPARFHRYSSSNLCPPYPVEDGIKKSMRRFGGGGIRLVNSGVRMAGDWFFQGVHVA